MKKGHAFCDFLKIKAPLHPFSLEDNEDNSKGLKYRFVNSKGLKNSNTLLLNNYGANELAVEH